MERDREMETRRRSTDEREGWKDKTERRNETEGWRDGDGRVEIRDGGVKRREWRMERREGRMERREGRVEGTDSWDQGCLDTGKISYVEGSWRGGRRDGGGVEGGLERDCRVVEEITVEREEGIKTGGEQMEEIRLGDRGDAGVEEEWRSAACGEGGVGEESG